jgi:hypothetical protein
MIQYYAGNVGEKPKSSGTVSAAPLLELEGYFSTRI